MKKILITLTISLLSLVGFSQVKPEQIDVGSSPNDRTGDPIRTAFLKYNRTVAAAWDSLAGHMGLFGVVFDSINNQSDSLQVHDVRLKAMEIMGHTHANKDTLDGTTSKFTIPLRSALVTAGAKNDSQDDSISWIGDSVRLHDNRLKLLEDGVYGVGTIKGTISDGEIAVGVGPDSIAGLPQTQPLLISLSAGADTVEFKIKANNPLIGMNSVQLTASGGSNPGGATETVIIRRYRSSTWVNMTSTGATFTGATEADATINTSNDDVLLGDIIQIIGSTGSGTAPLRVSCTVIFQMP